MKTYRTVALLTASLAAAAAPGPLAFGQADDAWPPLPRAERDVFDAPPASGGAATPGAATTEERVSPAWTQRLQLDPRTEPSRLEGGDGLVSFGIDLRVDAPAATARVSDGRAYPVGEIDLLYANPHPDLPAPRMLQQIMVQLLPTPSGYVAARPGANNQTLRLADLPLSGVDALHASAVNAVAAAVVRDFRDRGLMGVFVGPDPVQIAAAFTPDGEAIFGEDLRGGDDALRLIVRTSTVSSVRTVAQGQRRLDGSPINHPAHDRIRERSPLAAGDLADRDRLDDYLFDLNRHPGRTVAAEVFPGDDPAAGDAALGYLVGEAKPWTAFFNLSNTGTEETDDWRQRFGLLHTQLTGRDDVLSLEYITAGFEDSHALFASYEKPFESNDRLHYRIYGSYQDYEASDVGFIGADFSGTSFGLGGELIWNFKQRGPAFFDLVTGLRYENIEVSNPAGEQTEPFLVPYVGLGYERATQTATTIAYVGIELNLEGVAGTDEPDVDGLGRLNADAGWFKLPFSLTHSFYLEPIFDRDDWLDLSTGGSTLAHEMLLSVRGQWTPESRLNPQAQQVAGGLYSVRGYAEAVSAGDTVVIASAEYRLHLGRLNTPVTGENRAVEQFLGQPFRRFPQQPYGAADWDLIPKAFVDFGRTVNNDREAFEADETLLGAGLGVDFLYKRNLNLRADWGVALDDAAFTTAGSQQFHFSFTVLY